MKSTSSLAATRCCRCPGTPSRWARGRAMTPLTPACWPRGRRGRSWRSGRRWRHPVSRCGSSQSGKAHRSRCSWIQVQDAPAGMRLFPASNGSSHLWVGMEPDHTLVTKMNVLRRHPGGTRARQERCHVGGPDQLKAAVARRGGRRQPGVVVGVRAERMPGVRPRPRHRDVGDAGCVVRQQGRWVGVPRPW